MILFYPILIMPMFYMIQPQESSKSRLQKLQARADKLISGSGPIYKSLDWLSLRHRRDFHKCILVYKYNNLASSYLIEMFNFNDSLHSYSTRYASQLRSTKTRTAYYHRSFTVFGHKLWNDLPSNIQNCTTLPSFKNALYNIYLTKTQL